MTSQPSMVAASAPPAATVAQKLAAFAHDLRYEDIPVAARERAKYLILDAAGIALASTTYPFAERIFAGIHALCGDGASVVIGMPRGLPLRDAVLMNGALVHGLDFDDTHMGAIVHATASAFPCVLGVAEHVGASGEALLTAYVIGMETAIRIGLAANAGFHHAGFHPTGVVAHFSCALAAGRLMGLNLEQLATAQGITGSTAAASQEFLSEGAWNKRLHPGWAGMAGITAASLAKHSFVAPSQPYEGRFGLYNAYLGEHAANVDYGVITAGLGESWALQEEAIKPYPICHFTHSVADAALVLRQRHDLAASEVASIRALIPEETIALIAEPVAAKKRPSSDFDAKFSTQFITAAALVRGKFGLAELTSDALNDPVILQLADKVSCESDPNSLFPKYFSGGLIVTTTDGRELVHHEPINRGGGERALTGEDIVRKYRANAVLSVSAERAEAIEHQILDLDRAPAGALAESLRATEGES